MKKINTSRYAILGALLEKPSSGYEIKSLMGRSTVYFWKESDSTIYPILKKLSSEGKVKSNTEYVGKKKKEVFSITKEGREEFLSWIKSPTRDESQRNEFLLKLFFINDADEMTRLFEERLEKIKGTYKEFQVIEERLKNAGKSSLIHMRLKSLQYGLTLISTEMKWLKKQIMETR